MREPTLKIGFVIFNSDWKEELVWDNGHRRAAAKWIEQHGFTDLYNSMQGKNGICDEEDFLIDYIGAVKLYVYRGKYYCRIPRMVDPDKSYLKRFYRNNGYQIVGDGVYDECSCQKVKKFDVPYNRTVIKTGFCMAYNPYRDGD